MNTTLNKIRECKLNKISWSKLLKSLDKTEADNEPLSFKHILETIGIKDAAWCLQVLPYVDTCLFRAEVVELILPIFENDYPEDKQPRLSVQAVKDFHARKIAESELNTASTNAYNSAYVAFLDDNATAHDVAYITSILSNTNSIFTSREIILSYSDISDQDEQWRVIEELFIKHFV